jgi:hypothetical protein
LSLRGASGAWLGSTLVMQPNPQQQVFGHFIYFDDPSFACSIIYGMFLFDA